MRVMSGTSVHLTPSVSCNMTNCGGFCGICAPSSNGPTNESPDSLLDELAEWMRAGADAFWRFEESLPDEGGAT